jgi:hypothetical protein
MSSMIPHTFSFDPGYSVFIVVVGGVPQAPRWSGSRAPLELELPALPVRHPVAPSAAPMARNPDLTDTDCDVERWDGLS